MDDRELHSDGSGLHDIQQFDCTLRETVAAFGRLRTALAGQAAAARDAERQRIAADLHDGLGQSLSATKLGIQTRLARLSAADGSCGNCELAHGAIAEVQACIDEVRRIALDLHPSMLDQLGLIPTLSWFVRELSERQPELTVESRVGVAEAQIPPELRIVLFRVIQEATRNVVTHAAAHRLTIRLEHSASRLVLEVRDDGCGFADPESALERRFGFGLGSMRDRVEASGGLFEIHSHPAGGTAVVARWPVAAVEAVEDRNSSSA